MFRISTILLLSVCAAAAADLTGKWNVTATAPGGDREYKMELELRNEGGKLAGTMTSTQGSIALEQVVLEGDQLSYTIPTGSGGYKIKFTVAADALNGSYTSPDGTTGKAVATRAAAADIAGRWKGAAKSDAGREYSLELDLAVDAGRVRGTLTVPQGSVPIEEARLDGGEFTFKVHADEGTYTVKLAVTGNEMTGSYAGPGEKGKVTARR
jgi:hypothetical protein